METFCTCLSISRDPFCPHHGDVDKVKKMIRTTRTTRTYALLQVPEMVYAVVRSLLFQASYEHTIHRNPGEKEILDMHGIALQVESPQRPLRVLVESPYDGDVERNVKYARACMRDCINLGEAPFASHLLYTQPGILDDSIPHDRMIGIHVGLLWGEAADKTVVYTDLGISKGMEQGMANANIAGRPIERRSLIGWKDQNA